MLEKSNFEFVFLHIIVIIIGVGLFKFFDIDVSRTEDIDALYTDDTYNFISEVVTNEALYQLENGEWYIKTSKNSDFFDKKEKVMIARYMFDVEQEFKNELKRKDFFSGGFDLQNVRKEVELLSKSNPKFVASITEVLIVATQINNFYNEDGTLKTDTTLEQIIEAQSALQQLTNHGILRNELNLKIMTALSLINN